MIFSLQITDCRFIKEKYLNVKHRKHYKRVLRFLFLNKHNKHNKLNKLFNGFPSYFKKIL